MSNFLKSQFARFVFVGGIAAGANVISRILLSKYLIFEYAVALAYLIGLTVAFVLSRLFVFAPSMRSVQSQYARFWLVNLVALVQVWLVSVVLVNWVLPAIGWTFYPELTAHTIGVCSPVLTSYFLHKTFTFK